MRSTACLVRACEQLADPPAGSNSQTWGRPYLFFCFVTRRHLSYDYLGDRRGSWARTRDKPIGVVCIIAVLPKCRVTREAFLLSTYGCQTVLSATICYRRSSYTSRTGLILVIYISRAIACDIASRCHFCAASAADTNIFLV